jgi:hypothetical protein
MADYIIETALYSILSGASGITDICSTRIYPDVAEQGVAAPYIIYQQVSGSSDVAADGPTGFARSSWQITCWAGTKGECARLAEQVRLALNGYAGTVAQRTIRFVGLEGKTDLQSLMAGSDILRRYGKALTFRINYTEPIS